MAMVASAARLALSNIGFLIPFLAGEEFTFSKAIGEATTKSLSKYDIIALVVLVVGIVIYQIKPEKKKMQEYQQIPSAEENPSTPVVNNIQ